MKKVYYASIILPAIFLIFACAGPSRVEEDYGHSVRLSRINQTLNPEAAKNLEPVSGFDGKAAQITVEKYRKDFEKNTETPQQIFQMGGGTSSGAQSGGK